MMKLLFAAATLLTAPAHALSVSNLDDVAHQVVFEEVQGSKHIKIVAPTETIHSRAATGRVYLKNNEKQAVRIEELDRLVIWKDGNLQLQMRRHNRGGN